MNPADLVASVRAAGDPLHLLAADALVAECAEVEKLRARALLLEAVARLDADTIRAMQVATREVESDFAKRRPKLSVAARGGAEAETVALAER
jgi:hypothetical protein